MTYEVTHQAVLFTSDAHTSPQQRPAAVVLSDGTFLVASALYTDVGILIRLWHLAPDLVVLGVKDIDQFVTDPRTDSWPILVATSDRHAFLTSVAEFPSPNYSYKHWSWIIDCSGDAPLIARANFLFLNSGPSSMRVSGDYDVLQHSTLYDPATERVFVGSYGPFLSVLEVFSATTGLRLSVVQAASGDYSGKGCVGLYMDPGDSTKFAYIDPYCAPVYAGQGVVKLHRFTVSLDGLTATYTGSTHLITQDGGWTFAGGSPYIPGGPGVIANNYTASYTDPQFVNYYAPDGTVLISAPARIAWQGDMVSPNNANDLIAWYETYLGSDYGSGRRGNLYCVDQTTKVMELIPLPYVGAAPYSEGNGECTSLGADALGDIILVATNVNNYSYPRTYCTLVWVVDHGRKPNLVGNLLDDRVRFWGK